MLKIILEVLGKEFMNLKKKYLESLKEKFKLILRLNRLIVIQNL
jgi:hypothetical protein